MHNMQLSAGSICEFGPEAKGLESDFGEIITDKDGARAQGFPSPDRPNRARALLDQATGNPSHLLCRIVLVVAPDDHQVDAMGQDLLRDRNPRFLCRDK